MSRLTKEMNKIKNDNHSSTNYCDDEAFAEAFAEALEVRNELKKIGLDKPNWGTIMPLSEIHHKIPKSNVFPKREPG